MTLADIIQERIEIIMLVMLYFIFILNVKN